MNLRNLLGWSSALCLTAVIVQAQETNNVEKFEKQLKQLQENFEIFEAGNDLLNADESYSLLKCKQPWTLAVKEFSGGIAIQPAKAPTTLLEKLLGNKSEEHMSAIGKQAHEVARVLKQMGFDAYVLHTTTSSIVTVGAYADPEDDKLHQAQKQLRNMQFGQHSWVQLASNPLPMPVPRP